MSQGPEQRRLVRLAGTMNRKAERLGRPGRVQAIDLARILIRDHRKCRYCKIELQAGHGTFDHVMPFDRGGTNFVDNITTCCTSCNRTKFTKTPEQLAVYQTLELICPVDGKKFKPRYNDWARGMGRVCSRSCAARRSHGWMSPTSPSA